ncbi:transposase [Pseudoalteromonas sp. DL2-H2.2]|uniref:IS91 family transposase n=1 Tax=Pseudoalteromonas sp. DL2-H2.2 TaxID=2908889 RepID=UPI001F3D7B69|nr:transposase [Pseudoalteromonas sp. DL2-H2.2]MCF2908298.1 transposase [Pseudoalteromonas sp. DL2-H2.2]
MSHLHIADILNESLADYMQTHSLSYQQKRVCEHLMACRTGKLGYQRWACDSCAEVQEIGCSCRDRHCPRCQGLVTQVWAEKQQHNLLPCHYFHVVFTLPHELNELARYRSADVYNSLFRAAWATLSAFAHKKRHGQLGMTAVLHTWGQTLVQHIHLHCLIPAGSLMGDKWQGISKGYLYPVKALSAVFRGKMLSALSELGVNDKALNVPKKWCVYSKACLKYSERLVSYLARYTRKGMLHESRLVDSCDGQVRFTYRDSANGNKQRIMTLSHDAFIGRYLSHVLPRGFVRIRHYGFLANACRVKKRAMIRGQCGAVVKVSEEASNEERGTIPPSWQCKRCQTGRLYLISVLLADTSGERKENGQAGETVRTR